MQIYCCGCEGRIEARRTTGKEIYPHRSDLWSLPFWRCDHCRNYVGCHHKTADRYRLLGVIPTPEIRQARQRLHAVIDPMWKSGGKPERNRIYKAISRRVGYEFHTAEVRSLQEARHIHRVLEELWGAMDRKSKNPSYQPATTDRTDFSDMNVYDQSIPPWSDKQVIL